MTEEAKLEARVVTEEEYNKAIDRSRNFEARLTDYEKRYNGIDPERYKALEEEISILRKEATGGDPKKIESLIAKERQELEQALEKRYSSKLTETEKALNDREAKLRRLMVIKPAMVSAAEYFNADQLPLLEHVIESSLDLEGEEIIVKGPDGKPAPSIKDPRNPKMPLGEFMESLASKFPSSAKPSIGVGGKQPGSKIAPSYGGPNTLQQLSTLPDKGKQALKEMGQEKIEALFRKH